MPVEFVVLADGDDLRNFLIQSFTFHKIIIEEPYKKGKNFINKYNNVVSKK